MSIRLIAPTPLDGECVYSIVAAFTWRWFNGNRSGACALFCGATPAARDIPARLPHLASNLPESLGKDAVQLALAHTSLPIHLPFIDARRREALFAAIEQGKPMQFRLGIAPARLVCARALRLCPECVRRDRARFGRAYWHREHQLPGVLTCALHSRVLVISSVAPEARHGVASFVTPHQARAVRPESIKQEWMGHARKLSQEMEALFDLHVARPGPARLCAYYRHLLHEAGYTEPNGGISLCRLCADLNVHFGRSFLCRIGCLPSDKYGWVAALVRSPRSHQQPLRHVLLLNFLGRSVRHLNEAMGFELSRGPAKPHPYRIRCPVRMARLRPKVRLAWLEIARGAHVNQARKLAMYAWLYRNDREWLLTHRIARGTRSPDLAEWAKRDARLASMIPFLAARILRARPLRRVSRNAIASNCGATSWLVRDHSHLPLSVAAIKSASESVTDFAIRRLRELAKDPSLVAAPAWKLRVRAGISVALAKQPPVARALRVITHQRCPAHAPL